MRKRRESVVTVEVTVAATQDRVWRALTVPSEVESWDGVSALVVPEGYPAPGQHALWRTRFGLLPLTLHDHVGAVERSSAFSSTIDVAFVHVEETYSLTAVEDATRLVSQNRVTSRWPGLGGLAARVTRANVGASMSRLKTHCERQD